MIVSGHAWKGECVIRQDEWFACAAISLMYNRYSDNHGFSFAGVHFTRKEIIDEANRLRAAD